MANTDSLVLDLKLKLKLEPEDRIQTPKPEIKKQKSEHRKPEGRTSNENIHYRRDNHCTACFDAAFESTL